MGFPHLTRALIQGIFIFLRHGFQQNLKFFSGKCGFFPQFPDPFEIIQISFPFGVTRLQ
jgi:hypothetical protein